MMKPKNNTTELEFSHPLGIDKIPAAGLVKTLKPTEAERKSLAERFDLVELSNLTADLTIHPAGLDETINVTGLLTADVVQTCVVTLDPLPGHIEHTINVLFMPEEIAEPEDEASTLEMDTEDTETIINGTIDLGELVAQNLGIALDPYPRKPGIGLVEAEFGEEKPPVTDNPFAKLAEWKKKPKE